MPQVCHGPLSLPTTYQSLPFSIQDPVLFTGTIASNIAYGNSDATREQIEAAAREANCEFVWGMPKGFDTESKTILILVCFRLIAA